MATNEAVIRAILLVLSELVKDEGIKQELKFMAVADECPERMESARKVGNYVINGGTFEVE